MKHLKKQFLNLLQNLEDDNQNENFILPELADQVTEYLVADNGSLVESFNLDDPLALFEGQDKCPELTSLSYDQGLCQVENVVIEEVLEPQLQGIPTSF